ncbi:unnamed protein product [Porites evermanni]|uniref:Uncharacterized protein n=1 Tax=Porites evermanni TaxID=104178 RepID=A0ABN8R2I2_9CNID|nr:unnamed protein product [Porites evermanni]
MDNISKEFIKEKIFNLPGPFCSARRVYNSFSSNLRPSPQLTEECFRELEKQSLGHFKKVKRSMYFYKALPSSLNENHLRGFNLSLDDYIRTFLKRDDLLASKERNTMLHYHPLEKELREYLIKNQAPILDD